MLRNYFKILDKSAEANKKNSLFGRIFGHPFSLLIVALVEDTFISPNILTFISLCFSLLGSYYLAFNPEYIGLVYATLCIYIAMILDCADGHLARWKGLKSDFGGYFDVMTDQIQHRLIIIAIAVRFMNDMQVVWLAFAALAIITLVGHENLLQKIIKQNNKGIQEKRDTLTQGKKKGGIRGFAAWLIANFSSYYLYLVIFFLIDKPVWLLYFFVAYYSFWFLKRFIVFAIIRNKI